MGYNSSRVRLFSRFPTEFSLCWFALFVYIRSVCYYIIYIYRLYIYVLAEYSRGRIRFCFVQAFRAGLSRCFFTLCVMECPP